MPQVFLRTPAARTGICPLPRSPGNPGCPRSPDGHLSERRLQVPNCATLVPVLQCRADPWQGKHSANWPPLAGSASALWRTGTDVSSAPIQHRVPVGPPPLLATITGSITTGSYGAQTSVSATAWAISVVAIIPIFIASTDTSTSTARTCAATKSGGTKMHRRYVRGVLHGQSGDRSHGKAAISGNRRDIRLNPGPARGI